MNEQNKTGIVVFDLETTGLSVAHDQVVEFYGCKLDFAGNQVSELHLFIKPARPMCDEVINVHHITNEFLADKPSFGEVADQIVEFLKDSWIAGHNVARYDVPLLTEELLRCGKVPPYTKTDIMDSYAVEKVLFSHSLIESFKRAFGFEYSEKYGAAHGAKADVLGNIDLIKHQFESIGKTLENCADYRAFSKPDDRTVDFDGKLYRDENGDIRYNFGKAKDVRVIDDFGYGNWMLGQDFCQDTKRILREVMFGK